MRMHVGNLRDTRPNYCCFLFQAYSRTFDLGRVPPPYSPTDENPQYNVPQYSTINSNIPFLLYNTRLNNNSSNQSISADNCQQISPGSEESLRSANDLLSRSQTANNGGVNTLLQIVQQTLRGGRTDNDGDQSDDISVEQNSQASQSAQDRSAEEQSRDTGSSTDVSQTISQEGSGESNTSHSTPSISNKQRSSSQNLYPASSTIIQGNRTLKQSTNSLNSTENPNTVAKSVSSTAIGATDNHNQSEVDCQGQEDCCQGDSVTEAVIGSDFQAALCDSQSSDASVV